MIWQSFHNMNLSSLGCRMRFCAMEPHSCDPGEETITVGTKVQFKALVRGILVLNVLGNAANPEEALGTVIHFVTKHSLPILLHLK